MEDLIRRSDAIKAFKECLETSECGTMLDSDKYYELLLTIPSADRPQGDSVSKRYLLAEIDDLADEFSEVDENGLHSERWCGIVDAKLIIMNAPSVSDRPQGEWIPATWQDERCPERLKKHKCSVCGHRAETVLVKAELVENHYCNKAEPIIEYTHKEQLSKFCPNCGARMFAKDTNVPNKKGADDE